MLTPPQLQQMPPKPPKKGFFNKRLSVPVWAILLAIVLLISVFATSIYAIGNKSNPVKTLATTSSSSTNGPGTSIPASVPTSAPTDIPTSVSTQVGPSKVGGTITVNGMSCTLVSVEPIPGDEFNQPKPGDTFIVVHIEIVNKSGSDYKYYQIDFQAISGTGNAIYEVFAPSTYTANNEITLGTLISGGTLQGDLIFEEPIGDHKAEFSWQPNSLGSPTGNVWNLGL